MNSILSQSRLGYAKGIDFATVIKSDRSKTCFMLNNHSDDISELVAALIAGENKPLPLYLGELSLKFSAGTVTVNWTDDDGTQTASFDEIELMQLIEVESVGELVLARARKI